MSNEYSDNEENYKNKNWYSDDNWQPTKGDPFDSKAQIQTDREKAFEAASKKRELAGTFNPVPGKGGGAEPTIYRHREHGGLYEYLGIASAAGASKSYMNPLKLAIYRSLKTDELYYRDVADFAKRMEKLE